MHYFSTLRRCEGVIFNSTCSSLNYDGQSGPQQSRKLPVLWLHKNTAASFSRQVRGCCKGLLQLKQSCTALGKGTKPNMLELE